MTGGPASATDHDRADVTRLLGRTPNAPFTVVVRSADGLPAVIENAPFLEDGSPMPTRFWLVAPDLREAVSRLESCGGVRRAEAEVEPGELARAHERYAAERDAHIPLGHCGPRPDGGVGGTRRGVKCLHAHLAWWLAGGDDPVGEWVANQVDLTGLSPARPPGTHGAGPVAAVDCGTNSTRLLVAGADGSMLAREMRITRLGQGVDATGVLSPEAVGRTLAVLSEYRTIMEDHGTLRARLVATSAVRDAGNGAEFLRAASAVAGVTAELLTGQEEGTLACAGATAGLAPCPGDDVVVDIGGGSTELVVRRAGRVHAVSLDLGCVRLAERYLAHDPPLSGELEAAAGAVEAGLDLATAAVPELGDLLPGSRLLGLAGTVATLAQLEQGLVAYDRDRIHHYLLDGPAVERWAQTLGSEPASARLARPGMVPGRADVIVGGVLLLAGVMRRYGFDTCMVSESDILDGIVASLLQG